MLVEEVLKNVGNESTFTNYSWAVIISSARFVLRETLNLRGEVFLSWTSLEWGLHIVLQAECFTTVNAFKDFGGAKIMTSCTYVVFLIFLEQCKCE